MVMLADSYVRLVAAVLLDAFCLNAHWCNDLSTRGQLTVMGAFLARVQEESVPSLQLESLYKKGVNTRTLKAYLHNGQHHSIVLDVAKHGVFCATMGAADRWIEREYRVFAGPDAEADEDEEGDPPNVEPPATDEARFAQAMRDDSPERETNRLLLGTGWHRIIKAYVADFLHNGGRLETGVTVTSVTRAGPGRHAAVVSKDRSGKEATFTAKMVFLAGVGACQASRQSSGPG